VGVELKTYYVYILLCTNGNYYCGYTTDIKRRYQEHCDGSKKCKYTRSFPPVSLAACWEIQSDTSSNAMKLERAVKRLSKELKKKLINNPRNIELLM